MSDKGDKIQSQKRTNNEANCQRNENKKAKNEGRQYTDASNAIIPAKEFEDVKSCCPKKCFEKVENSYQKIFFNNFWKDAADYKTQNIMLSGLMILRRPPADGNTHGMKVISWNYYFHCIYLRAEVCQAFLCRLLQINKGRFTTIQKKLISNVSLQDKRGTHSHHILKLTEKVKMLIKEHCLSLPHSQSMENSQMLTFDRPDLTLKRLYNLFIKYYESRTGDTTPPLTVSTYSKFFNRNLNFTFKKLHKPDLDVPNPETVIIKEELDIC